MRFQDDVEQPKWYKGLRARVTLLLTLTALPIGLIAVFQTTKLSQTAEKNAELALLTLSDQVVQDERLVIQRAIGSANMLGGIVPFLLENPERCEPFLNAFLAKETEFSFAGVLPSDGVMTCSSVARTLDFSTYDNFSDLMANPRPTVVMNPAAPGSETAVVIVSTPYVIDDVFAGYVSISIPQATLVGQDAFAELPAPGLIELFTFNNLGEVLTAERDIGSASELLPADLDEALLAVDEAMSFRAKSRSGTEYIYSVVPVPDSLMTIVGVWNVTPNADTQLLPSPVPASAFPIIMWVASVIVAIMALYTLVIRHITVLRHQMSDFANNRKLPKEGFHGSVPSELIEMQTRFFDMTDSILREEARLEAMVREQNVLAKEVHHRVKNNLQMIASIMNMQIRNAEHDETVETLQRVQDRITSLADVHKGLYAAEAEGRVNVGALISSTVQNSIEVGVPDVSKIDLRKKIDDVWMYPDQVVPLSLLASEAITNAMKYMAGPDGERPILQVELHQKDDMCELIVANSTAVEVPPSGTGIGSKLIKAFGIKLGAEPEIITTDSSYKLIIRFPIAAFELESMDY